MEYAVRPTYYIIEYNNKKTEKVKNYWFKLLIRYKDIKSITKRTHFGCISVDEVIRGQD